MSMITDAHTRDKERLADYQRAIDFYEGHQWADRIAERKQNKMTVNYVRVLVRKVTSFVMQGFEVSIEPNSESQEEAARQAEAALSDAARHNQLDQLDYATELDAAVLGDGAYRITWSEATSNVVVTAPDVRGLFPERDPADPTRWHRVLHAHQLTPAQVAEHYGISIARPRPLIDIAEVWTDEEHNVTIDNATTPAIVEANPYGFIPFLIYPNEQKPKQWNGESDVLPLVDIAREFNAEVTRAKNIMELSGFPITILQGVDQSEGIAARAGALWELPADARAYVLDLLQHGATTQHLEYLQMVKSALHDLSETPRAAFGDNQRDLSGVALEVELLPLLHKVARKRTIRTTVHEQRAAMILQILDLFTGTQHVAAGLPLVSWSAPTPRDRAREIDNEVKLTTAALSSRRSAIARLGDADPDQELDDISGEAARLPPVDTKSEAA